MNAPSVTDTDPASRHDAEESLAESPFDEPSDRIVLGVAGHVADGLGVDALWVRLGFVLPGLVGGLGVVLYLALWLTLFGPDRTGLPWVRFIGGAVAVVGVPWLIALAGFRFVDGPVAVVALLIGLTLALWQPRNAPSERPLPSRATWRTLLPPPTAMPADVATPMVPGDIAGHEANEFIGAAPPVEPSPPTVRRRRVRRQRTRREPSMLGRLTFGLAVIVAAVGALIDLFNGGRLHPEQWLGAAALICGVGLLVGAIRGRAWWLVVPALLFAGTGYAAGIMSRLGIDATDGFGNQSVYVSEERPGGTETIERAFGTVWISVESAPAELLTIDATVAIGGIEMSVADNVTVEIRADSDRGHLVVNGEVVSGGTSRLGPDGPPQVIVDARLGIGDVNTFTYDPGDRLLGEATTDLLGAGPFDPLVLEHRQGTEIDEGVGLSADGWVVLAYGEGLLDPSNMMVVGDGQPEGPTAMSILTSMGPFFVDGSTLQTPIGVLYDLDDLRAQNGIAVSDSNSGGPAPTTTIIPSGPSVTLAPSSVDATVPGLPLPVPSVPDPPVTTTTVGG